MFQQASPDTFLPVLDATYLSVTLKTAENMALFVVECKLSGHQGS